MLKLEPPYKDDAGQRLPVLFDIYPDGTRIYEPQVDPQKSLAERLRRVFAERGVDFFERNANDLSSLTADPKEPSAEDDQSDGDEEPAGEEKDESATPGPMTPEDLYKMRVEVLPQLFTALGEMTHAKELLSMLLASAQAENANAGAGVGGGGATLAATLAAMNASSATSTAQQVQNPGAAAPTSTLSATAVTKPAPILSVQAFNAQLTLGGKDEALRKAAGVFKNAAESIERARVRGERYWVDALKIRRANWGLIPAPLPFGAPTGKGADKTSKDFLISYGLEESPAIFRRRAVGRMPTYEKPHEPLVFPHRTQTRLLISVSSVSPSEDGVDTVKTVLSQNIISPLEENASLEAALRAAQQEIVEQEIFASLVREAGSLPTASARVSERLIVLDAAQGIELKFELIDADALPPPSPASNNAKCDFIYYALQALLLRQHAHAKRRRLGTIGVMRAPNAPSAFDATPPPLLLRPVIDLLQYEGFLKRLRAEMELLGEALRKVGIENALRFEGVGGTGVELVELLDPVEEREGSGGAAMRERERERQAQGLGGEAVIRIDARHTVRLTFRAPSSLTAHLSQATLLISSIPQLRMLLGDEVERCLLARICEVGRELCEGVGGIWFVDINRCVGRWDGCVLNFRIYVKHGVVNCAAFRLGKTGLQQGDALTYSTDLNVSLLSWAENTIRTALAQ
ncbi:mediator of RNA polymerase II transcription subunit 17 [Favolaschia claudopus]|uniref:Mediator of RNA polymerase II transcription subunit 17 n=1 Tax=Favolaschia claudopus TaxID=2862362 RepID=A0AAW0EBH5_9AGAR